MLSPRHHLVYAGKFAWDALESLAVPNEDRRTRMINGISRILRVPRQGMPVPILQMIENFDQQFLTDGSDRYEREGLVAYNVRKMKSWKKREKAIGDLLWVSVGIIEAGAVHLHSSGWLEGA